MVSLNNFVLNAHSSNFIAAPFLEKTSAFRDWWLIAKGYGTSIMGFEKNASSNMADAPDLVTARSEALYASYILSMNE